LKRKALKTSIDAKDTALGSLPTNEQATKGKDDETKLAKMSMKKKKKEVAKRVKEVKREKKKKDKELDHLVEKAKRATVKAGKKAKDSSKKSKVVDAILSAGDEVLQTYL
jgi:hypothetical protein